MPMRHNKFALNLPFKYGLNFVKLRFIFSRNGFSFDSAQLRQSTFSHFDNTISIFISSGLEHVDGSSLLIDDLLELEFFGLSIACANEDDEDCRSEFIDYGIDYGIDYDYDLYDDDDAYESMKGVA